MSQGNILFSNFGVVPHAVKSNVITDLQGDVPFSQGMESKDKVTQSSTHKVIRQWFDAHKNDTVIQSSSLSLHPFEPFYPIESRHHQRKGYTHTLILL